MTSDSRWESTSSTARSNNEAIQLVASETFLSSIITSLSGLPTIRHGDLRYQADLGQGSYGTVALEEYSPRTSDPYLVAVKYLSLRGRSSEELRRAYTAVKREIRVFIHQPFKNHVSLLQAIGSGTASRFGFTAHPYLVLEYSKYGTLATYMTTRAIPERECRELALDIAIGIDILHKNKILHGDIKPSNILIFDADYHTSPVRRIAKISDFGNSVTEEEVIRFGQLPYGTQAYVAPELDTERHVTSGNHIERGNKPNFFTLLCRSDVYSFGLLLWELCRLKEATAGNKRTHESGIDINLRRRLHSLQTDALVEMATEWAVRNLLGRHNLVTQQIVYEHRSVVGTALKLCLRDNPQDRAPMEEVIKALTIASGEYRSLRLYSSSAVEVRPTSDADTNNAGHPHETLDKTTTSLTVPDYRLSARYRPGGSAEFKEIEDQALVFNESHILIQDLPHPDTPAHQITTLVHLRKPYRAVEPSLVADGQIDVFQASERTLPEWNAQVKIYEGFDTIVNVSNDPNTVSNARLQLAACHFSGNGTDQNNIEGSHVLSEAAKTNFVAAALQARAWFAVSSGERHLHPPTPPCSVHGIETRDENNELIEFAAHFRIFQRLAGRQIIEAIRQRMDVYAARDHICSTANRISAGFLDDRLMRQLFTSRSIPDIIAAKTYNPRKTSLALTLSYQLGLLNVAEPLTRTLTTFVPTDGAPTPLHWLISFEASAASLLASLLINGPHPHGSNRGMCKALLDSVTEKPVRFPEHAMELFGTPLHWAVRVGNLPLVKVLVRLGANINARCFPQQTSTRDPWIGNMPYQSPLDVAAMFHYSDIVDYLLQEGAEVCGGDGLEHHTALHMVGHISHPLARMVIHGRLYLRMVRETIERFLRWGLDINTFARPYVTCSYTPLRWALDSLRTEAYIVSIFLSLGASEPLELQPQDVPLVILVTNAERYRPNATWKLEAILHLIKDVNERIEGADSRRNALQICIEDDNKNMATILASSGQLDIEYRVTKHQYTPLTYAAVLGRFEIARWLLQNGSAMEPNGDNEPPLQIAVRLRHLEVIVLLVGWGAPTCFGPFDAVTNLPRSSILHQAVMGLDKQLRQSSFMDVLLKRLPNLKTPKILNQKHIAGNRTPLHLAATRGDFQAVQTLLEAGADPNITTEENPEMRAHRLFVTCGDPLEVVMKHTAFYDRVGPHQNEQPWLKGNTRDSPDAKQYRNSLDEIRILLTQAQGKTKSGNAQTSS